MKLITAKFAVYTPRYPDNIRCSMRDSAQISSKRLAYALQNNLFFIIPYGEDLGNKNTRIDKRLHVIRNFILPFKSRRLVSTNVNQDVKRLFVSGSDFLFDLSVIPFYSRH
jgi:hypothetical protein